MIDLERRDSGPLRIGHRGAAALAPENTLRSFRAAHEVGVDLIEFDVLALDGGELVVAHSDDLCEVSHGAASGPVRSRSLAELREACPELPTLDEALGFFVDEAAGVGVHVDLKAARAAEDVALALGRFGLLDRSIVTSFHVSALRRLAAVEPRVRTGVTFPRDPLGIHGRRGSSFVVDSALRVLRTVTPQLARALLWRSHSGALVVHHALVSPRLVRYARSRGVPVVAWTVDDPDDLRRVDEAGVQAVVANDPSIFVSTLQT